MVYKYVEMILVEMSFEFVEKDLIFVGLVGMIDLERKEVVDVVKVVKEVGICLIMIMGDYCDIVEVIVVCLGIIKEGDDDVVIIGVELNELLDEKFV